VIDLLKAGFSARILP